MLRAEGTPTTAEDAFRVWVILDEVTEGSWGAQGRVWRFADIAAYVTGTDALATSQTQVVHP